MEVKVKTPPCGRKAEAVNKVGPCGRANRYYIIVIDDAVSIDILILDVAGHDVPGITEVLAGAVADIFIILEQAQGDQTLCLIHAVAGATEVGITVHHLIGFGDLVLAVGEIAADLQHHIGHFLIQLKIPVEPVGLHTAHVGGGVGALNTHHVGQIRSDHIDAVPLFVEVVDRQPKLVSPQVKVYSQVVFFGNLPGYVVGGYPGICQSRIPKGTVQVAPIVINILIACRSVSAVVSKIGQVGKSG